MRKHRCKHTLTARPLLNLPSSIGGIPVDFSLGPQIVDVLDPQGVAHGGDPFLGDFGGLGGAENDTFADDFGGGVFERVAACVAEVGEAGDIDEGWAREGRDGGCGGGRGGCHIGWLVVGFWRLNGFEDCGMCESGVLNFPEKREAKGSSDVEQEVENRSSKTRLKIMGGA